MQLMMLEAEDLVQDPIHASTKSESIMANTASRASWNSRTSAGRSMPLVVLVICLCAAQEASADGWKIEAQGVKAQGLSGAGRSIYIDDASTVWFNPANMIQLTSNWTFTAAPPIITYRLAYTDRGSTSVLGQPLTGAPTANGGQTSAIPHGYLVRRFTNRWWGGVGINFPFGLGSDYGETWIGRYHATQTRLTVANLDTTVAFKVNDRFSIGGGLDVQHGSARLANMIDFGSIGAAAGLPLVPQTQDGKIELNATDWGVGYDLSMTWDVNRRGRVGIVYRSQIEHTLKGTAQFTVPAAALPLTIGGAFKDTSAATALLMPGELSASESFQLGPKWDLLGDLTWTNWSRFQQFAVTFDNPLQPPLVQSANFRDSWRGAVGANYRPSGSWQFRMGVLAETTPVRDATRTPRLPEVNNVAISGGASYRLNDHDDLDFSFSHLLPHDAAIQLQDPSAGQLRGSVRWHSDIVAAGITFRF